MATTLTGSVRLSLDAVYTNDRTAAETRDVYDLVKSYTFANGTGADQADLIFSASDTIAASGTKTWDLLGTAENAFGVALAAVELTGIVIIADAANTNNVLVGGATNAYPIHSAAPDQTIVRPGGTFAMLNFSATGLGTATGGSTDEILITNSGAGTSVTYKIYLIGRSA